MANPSIYFAPQGGATGKVCLQVPNTNDTDLNFLRAGALPSYNATVVNSDGLIEEVLSNIPRFNHLNEVCPSFLTEPQSTNSILRNRELDNPYWLKNEVTISENNVISPMGDSMYLMKESTNTAKHFLNTPIITITNEIQTFSIFFKKNIPSTRYLRLDLTDTSLQEGARALFDTLSGDIALPPEAIGSATQVASKTENYGNGIYRASVSVKLNLNISQCIMKITMQHQDNYFSEVYRGDGISGFNLWGAQLDALPYASSFIPTVDSAVTRVAETVFKTELSSYINSQEGVLYAECKILTHLNPLTNTNRFNIISLNDGSINNKVEIGFSRFENNIMLVTTSGGVNQASLLYEIPSSLSYVKMAISYKLNKVTFFVNGVKVKTDTSAVMPIGMNTLSFGNGTPFANFYGNVKNLQVYKTALTDAELIDLTQ